MTLNPRKALSIIAWVCSPYINKYNTYEELPDHVKATITANCMKQLASIDPFFIYEKDGEHDKVLTAMASVVDTSGNDAKANQALIDAVLSVYLFGNDTPPAFAKEITATLQGEIFKEENDRSSKD